MIGEKSPKTQKMFWCIRLDEKDSGMARFGDKVPETTPVNGDNTDAKKALNSSGYKKEAE